MYDKYMKKAVQMVPNAVYVKGASRNYFSMLEGQKEIDYHYSKPEYLRVLCNVWKAVINNYIKLEYKNDILNELMKYNKEVEFQDTVSKGDPDMIRRCITECAEKYADILIKHNIDEREVRKEIWKYYNRNYLAHFGCTNRNAVEEGLLGYPKK